MHYPCVTSTMDIASQLAKEGVKEGTVIIASEQTQARGRLGRTWVSPAGESISLSVVLRPTVVQLKQLNMVASLATLRSITAVAGVRPSIKWPNDILMNGRKVSGILIENIFEGANLKAAVVGIGINVNFDPASFPEIAATATTLSIEAGRSISSQDLTRHLLNELDELYRGLQQAGTIYDSWIPFVETLGKWVRVRSGDHVLEGHAVSVTDNGSLILRRSDGSTLILDAGEVTLQT